MRNDKPVNPIPSKNLLLIIKNDLNYSNKKSNPFDLLQKQEQYNVPYLPLIAQDIL